MKSLLDAYVSARDKLGPEAPDTQRAFRAAADFAIKNGVRIKFARDVDGRYSVST